MLFNQNRVGKRLEYCRKCLQHFYSVEKLNSLILQCKKVDPQRTEFPNKKNKFVNFINFKNKIRAPYAVYADFEAFNKVCDKPPEESTNGKPSTEKIADQKICSYAYKLVCCLDDKFSKSIKLYRGKKAAAKFVRDMLDEEKYCDNILKGHFNKKKK